MDSVFTGRVEPKFEPRRIVEQWPDTDIPGGYWAKLECGHEVFFGAKPAIEAIPCYECIGIA